MDDAGLEDTLARYVTQGVFGSTELVVGLHLRKLVCALDLFDWEESGAKAKNELKMSKIPGIHVRKSLSVWMPPGQGRAFQDAMEALGEALGSIKQGFWGKLDRVIKRHYNAADKKLLMDMVTSVTQFYKVTKKGGRRKAGCC